MTTENKLQLIRMSEVELQWVEWRWYPYMPSENQDCNIASRSLCMLEDDIKKKIEDSILCIVAFFLSAAA